MQKAPSLENDLPCSFGTSATTMNTFYSVAATSRKNLLFRHFFSIEKKKSHANLSILKGGVTIKLGTNALVGLVAVSQGDSKLKKTF